MADEERNWWEPPTHYVLTPDELNAKIARLSHTEGEPWGRDFDAGFRPSANIYERRTPPWRGTMYPLDPAMKADIEGTAQQSRSRDAIAEAIALDTLAKKTWKQWGQ